MLKRVWVDFEVKRDNRIWKLYEAKVIIKGWGLQLLEEEDEDKGVSFQLRKEV